MKTERPDQYRILHEADLREYLAGLPELASALHGEPRSWTITEVGDGNLNLVFIVKGARGGVAVKQALPYVRLVGESWPLPLSRAHYEYLALEKQAQLGPGLVPVLLHHNEALALTVMELLEPHIILRKGLVAGTQYPHFVDYITTFMARTLFFTSDLAIGAAAKKEAIAAFAGNHALCKITEDLIFTDHTERLRRTLDVAVSRRHRRRVPRRSGPACRDLAPQAQIHGEPGSADSW
jgi:5-methylthioribose kinase